MHEGKRTSPGNIAGQEPVPAIVDPTRAVQSEPPPVAAPVAPKIRYEVGIDDLLAFNRFHLSKTKALRTGAFYWVSNIALGVGVGVAILFDATRYYAFAFFAGVLALATLSQLSVASRIKNLYREGENRGIFCWHELEVDGDDLIGRSPVFYFRLSIGGIERLVFRPGYTFIYYSAVAAYIVPQRKVTDGDFATFREALVRAWDAHHPDVSIE